MKKFLIVFASGVVFTSCTGTPDSTTELSSDTAVKDTVQAEAVVAVDERLSGPMLRIANYLDSLGYVSDSTRLGNVYTFLRNNVLIYGGRHTFYACVPAETVVTDLIVVGDLPVAFDSLIYGNPEPVIEYFFTTPTKDESGWYTDGIVEQWTFKDSVQARTAVEALVLTPNVHFHNAPLMVCYVDNRMYVFHSRATPSMYKMKPYFLDFVEENNAVIVSREVAGDD